jgi:hypothetical protein
MVRIATKHTTAETVRVAAAEVSDRVDGIVVCDGRLVAGHGLFNGRSVNANRSTNNTGHSRNFVLDRSDSNGVRVRRRGSIHSSEGGIAAFWVESTGDSLIHDSFLGTYISVMADITHTEGAKSSKLSGMGGQNGKRWGSIESVGDNQILDVS